MSVDFETPATRVIKQFSGKDSEQFRIPVDLPDLSFLRALSVQGRLRYFIGSTVGAGTIITITPNEGETIFIYKLYVSAETGVPLFQLINNGVVRLSQSISSVVIGQLTMNILDSLVGDGVKTITLTNDTASATATILGWSENTSRIRDVAI